MYPRGLPLLKRLVYAACDPFLRVRVRPGELRPSTRRQATDSVGLSVSIVSPSLNQGAFLERTIASVVNQHYPALEYVVQDGGSSDASLSILKQHGPELTFWESRPDRGQSAAINAGFRRTIGAIMAYLNSDDILFPGALRYVSGYFAAHPDIHVVYSHGLVIDEHDQPLVLVLLPRHSDRALRSYDFVPQPTLFWRRSLWEAVGSHLDESLHYAMDWDLLLRFLDVGARFARLPTFLAGFRLHDAQKTLNMRHLGSSEVARLRRFYARRGVSFAEVVVRSSPHLLRRALFTAAYRLGGRIEFP